MGTASKALDLLTCFTRQADCIGLSDLVRMARIDKTTCYRLVSELVQNGFLDQMPVTRSDRIRPAAPRLVALCEANVCLRPAVG